MSFTVPPFNTKANLDHLFSEEDSSDEGEVPLLLNADLSQEIVARDNHILPDQNISLNLQERIAQDIKEAIPSKKVQNPVPVTILSGFLGSGKTTLLQHILKSTTLGRRIAIIENEISGNKLDRGDGPNGALNIESFILRDGVNNDNLSDLIELPNGCICCTVKDSLVVTLEMLLQKKHDIDYIIIECSGMANPGPIASVFWLDDALQSQLKLDGIVTMVDARNFEMQIAETSSSDKYVDHNELGQLVAQRIGDEAVQQVAYADRIIINKIDLLAYNDQEMINRKIDSIKDIIRSINRRAPIRTTTFSQIFDIDWLLDTRSFSLERFYDNPVSSTVLSPCLCNSSFCGECSESIIENLTHVTSSAYVHGHTTGITTVVIIEDCSVYLSKVTSWLATILWPDQDMASTSGRGDIDQDTSGSDLKTSNQRSRTVAQGQRNMKIFRMKGLLSMKFNISLDGHSLCQLDDEDLTFVKEGGLDQRRYILQAVNDIWDIQPASQDLCWENSSIRSCKLVIIGRFLNEETLRSGFLSCTLA